MYPLQCATVLAFISSLSSFHSALPCGMSGAPVVTVCRAWRVCCVLSSVELQFLAGVERAGSAGLGVSRRIYMNLRAMLVLPSASTMCRLQYTCTYAACHSLVARSMMLWNLRAPRASTPSSRLLSLVAMPHGTLQTSSKLTYRMNLVAFVASKRFHAPSSRICAVSSTTKRSSALSAASHASRTRAIAGAWSRAIATARLKRLRGACASASVSNRRQPVVVLAACAVAWASLTVPVKGCINTGCIIQGDNTAVMTVS